MTAENVVIALGGLLIVAGIVMVIFQMRKEMSAKTYKAVSRGADFGAKGIKVKTTHPGIILIGIGAVMAIAGAGFLK